MPRKKTEQFNSFETANGLSSHLGAAQSLLCYKSSTNIPNATGTLSGRTTNWGGGPLKDDSSKSEPTLAKDVGVLTIDQGPLP